MAQTQLNDNQGNRYIIECFDLQKDYDDFIRANSKNIDFSKVVYHGKVYGATKEVKDLFNNNLLQHIKRNVYHNTDFIIIHS